jgi:hypothetical protein
MSFSKEAEAPWRGSVEPVLISASAFSPSIPARDLYVSQRHAIFNKGALVAAKELVNGKTIKIATRSDLNRLDYFHLEFQRHEVIYAEGLAAESLLDASRESFSNFAEYKRLYGSEPFLMKPYAPAWRYDRCHEHMLGLARLAVTTIGVDLRDPSQLLYEQLHRRATHELCAQLI